MKARQPKWLGAPEDHDYPAACDYLSLVMSPHHARAVVATLRARGLEMGKAKDLLRASQLPQLGRTNPHVAADLAKIAKGEKLSPVLLVRGAAGAPLIVADGYHRICAAWLTDENAEVPYRIAAL